MLRIISFSGTFLLFCLIRFNSNAPHNPTALSSSTHPTTHFLTKNQAARLDWWLRRYADPATGNIPTARLHDAMDAAQKIAASLATDRNGLASVLWKENGPTNLGGRVTDLCFDRSDPSGNTLWVASSSGGLWRTTNAFSTANPTYTRVAEGFLPAKISSIEQHPTDANLLYLSAMSPGGIWKSTNRGLSWTRLRSTAAAQAYFTRVDLAVLPDGTVLAADYNQVLRSTDGGSTWTVVFSGQFVQDLDVTASGKIFLLGAKSIFISENNGLTWAARSNGFVGNGYFAAGRIAAAPSDPNRLYVLQPDPTKNYGRFNFYRSSDAGLNWQKMTVPTTAFGVSWASALAVDPLNAERVFIGSLNLNVSADGGQTMKAIPGAIHSDQQCLAFAPGNSANLFLGNDGGLYRSTTAQTLTPIFEIKNNGWATTEVYALAPNPAAGSVEVFGGSQDNGLFKTSSNGGHVKISAGDGGMSFYDRDQPAIQIASLQQNLVLLTGNNWLNFNSLSIGGGEFIAAMDYEPATNTLFTPQAQRNGFARVRNVGTTNTLERITFPANVALPFFNIISAITCSPNRSGTVYLGNADGYVFKIENASDAAPTVTIIRQKQASARNVANVAVEKGNENHLVVAYSNYGVVNLEETLDGGLNWRSIEGNLPDMPVNWFAFAPGDATKALLATDLGVWATDLLQGNATVWFPASSGLNQNVQVMHLGFRESDKMLFAASYGRGIFSTDFFKNSGTGNPPPPPPPPAANYCASTSNHPWHEWIERVQVGSLNHFTGKSQYGNFTSLTTTLARGTEVNVSLSAGFSFDNFDEHWKIWIDFNQNKSFNDPGEEVFSQKMSKSAYQTFSQTVSGKFSVPATALPGTTRMRVSLKRSAAPGPCETLPFGEVEDYSVQISGSAAPLAPGSDPDAGGFSVKKFEIFPNPASDFASLELSAWLGRSVEIEVLDLRGRPVFFKKIERVETEVWALDLKNFESGAYVARLRTPGQRVVVRRFLVAKM